MDEYEFTQDVDRDARIVKAGIEGGIVPLAKALGWTMAQLHAHDEWLRQQPTEYMDTVIDAAYPS